MQPTVQHSPETCPEHNHTRVKQRHPADCPWCGSPNTTTDAGMWANRSERLDDETVRVTCSTCDHIWTYEER